ncbi:MAG: S-adenosylmethionine:tRNA ribosyltransferase-isomerase [Parcubacteria group bacterium Gr01-1014_20]|nr:MAG: S-adenosylmethionine:tRNA ribosyltransferase-isomerase [Parcubacteria group bacterium Gr01-1014_20]
MTSEKILQRYSYQFPENLIAKEPASPRDSANLLVYSQKTKKVSWTKFIKLVDYLLPGTVLVFNKTKVIPARLKVRKETGGGVRLLYIGKNKKFIKVLADRKLAIGSRLEINKKLKLYVSKREDRIYFLKPLFSINRILDILTTHGQTPIPPYIKHSPLKESELREKYQTIFASEPGSVAAPTAALHFTKRLFKKLKSAKISIKFITLHVNLGTFSPITSQNLETSRLHEEQYEIDKKTAQILNKSKQSRLPIIAVGTTTLRALESAVDKQGRLRKLSGMTDLFIQEGYHFKFINGLITNFHVPKSSLLMLVSALIGRKKTIELYQKAIQKKFRFFSFGDGMLIN